VDSIAHHGVWIAGILFQINLLYWSLRNVLDKQGITKAQDQRFMCRLHGESIRVLAP